MCTARPTIDIATSFSDISRFNGILTGKPLSSFSHFLHVMNLKYWSCLILLMRHTLYATLILPDTMSFTYTVFTRLRDHR